MKKASTIRRIIGITALVLWGVAVYSIFIFRDEGARIAHQLDGWAFGIALVLTPAYAIMLTIRIGSAKHWLIKTAARVGCAIVILVCGFLIFASTVLIIHDKIVWSNNDYVVYSEFDDFCQPTNYVLYRRDNLLYRKMCHLRAKDWGYREEVKYKMYDTLDLIIEEISYNSLSESDSICYDTIFYRLSDGHRYGQDKNDSLLALIK